MLYLRKMMVFIVSMISLSLIAACQSDNAEMPSNQEEVAKPVASKPEVSPGERIKSDFLEQVKPGMKEDEIRSIFGSDFKLLVNAMEGNETWRYDIGKKEDYHFDDQGIDQVDLAGLKNGQVQQLMFMDWGDNGELKSAALFMPSEDKAGFTEVRIMEDGSTEENYSPF